MKSILLKMLPISELAILLGALYYGVACAISYSNKMASIAALLMIVFAVLEFIHRKIKIAEPPSTGNMIYGANASNGSVIAIKNTSNAKIINANANNASVIEIDGDKKT